MKEESINAKSDKWLKLIFTGDAKFGSMHHAIIIDNR